jgi:hypothetical protein
VRAVLPMKELMRRFWKPLTTMVSTRPLLWSQTVRGPG